MQCNKYPKILFWQEMDQMTPNNKTPIKEVTTGEQIYLTWRTFLKFALSPRPLSVTSSKFSWFTVGTFKSRDSLVLFKSQNSIELLMSFFCLSSFVWKITSQNNVELYRISNDSFFENYLPKGHQKWKKK